MTIDRPRKRTEHPGRPLSLRLQHNGPEQKKQDCNNPDWGRVWAGGGHHRSMHSLRTPCIPRRGQYGVGNSPDAYFFFFGFLVSFFMSLPLAIADSPSLLLSSSMRLLK
jgi:hypothetical protein